MRDFPMSCLIYTTNSNKQQTSKEPTAVVAPEGHDAIISKRLLQRLPVIVTTVLGGQRKFLVIVVNKRLCIAPAATVVAISTPGQG